MFQESFEIEIKKGKKIPKNTSKVEDEEEGSELEEEERDISSDMDEEEEEVLEYLKTAFDEVGEVTRTDFREFYIDFYKQNAVLIDDGEDYDFDFCGDVPILTETEYFIPFVNFIKKHEIEMSGIALNTNLEGGGGLII